MWDHSGAIERRIDQAIRAHSISSGPITIAVSLFGNASAVSFESVLDKYRRAGWRAEYVNDSRDGDFIKLELP